MASSSKFIAIFFLIAIISAPLSHAARPEPSFASRLEAEKHHQGTVAVAETEQAEDISCEGIEETECLMRRTLVAHTDYIYTQKHTP